jgi:hypothetical protein
MIDPSVLRALAAAGATTDMLIAAVEAAHASEQEKIATKRAKDAERQRKHRASQKTPDVTVTSRDIGGHDVTEGDTQDGPLPLPLVPPNPPINPYPDPETNSRRAAHRMPKGYRLAEEDRQFARDLGWSESEIDDGEAEHVDYWSNPKLPASKALKTDWAAVWRNRVRDIGKRRGSQPRSPTNVTKFRGGHDENRSATAAAKRLYQESIRRDEEERRDGPMFALRGPESRDGADGVLPEGRGFGPGYLRSFGG